MGTAAFSTTAAQRSSGGQRPYRPENLVRGPPPCDGSFLQPLLFQIMIWHLRTFMALSTRDAGMQTTSCAMVVFSSLFVAFPEYTSSFEIPLEEIQGIDAGKWEAHDMIAFMLLHPVAQPEIW